jgi:DNA-binding NtrC family response regulator
MALNGTPLLLLIDDEPAQKRLISAIAARSGWRTLFAGDADAALATLASREGHSLDAVLIDQWNPAIRATDIIRRIHGHRADLPVVILTAQQQNVFDAVEAMRAGAADYLTKPVAPDRLMAALGATLDRSAARIGELRPLTEKLTAPLAFNEIVGGTPPFLAALAIAAKAARTRVPVLIEGESGVGKEVIAQAIHSASPRHRSRMSRSIAAPSRPISSRSELFGHERGAFTGAFDGTIGKFVDADMGTIFLDEVSELPLDAQVKLLRCLQEGEVSRSARAARACRRTAYRRHQQGAGEGGRGRPLPRGSLLPPQRMHVAVPPCATASDIPALARHLLARISRRSRASQPAASRTRRWRF